MIVINDQNMLPQQQPQQQEQSPQEQQLQQQEPEPQSVFNPDQQEGQN